MGWGEEAVGNRCNMTWVEQVKKSNCFLNKYADSFVFSPSVPSLVPRTSDSSVSRVLLPESSCFCSFNPHRHLPAFSGLLSQFALFFFKDVIYV